MIKSHKQKIITFLILLSFMLAPSFVKAKEPSVTTGSVTYLTSSSATLDGSANPESRPTTAWINYKDNADVTTGVTVCKDPNFWKHSETTWLGAGHNNKNFYTNLSSLQAGHKYDFCAVISYTTLNEFLIPIAKFKYGDIKEFDVPWPPVVGPAGYVQCGLDGEQCQFPTVTIDDNTITYSDYDLAYGAAGAYKYVKNISNGYDCTSTAVGGDPAPGVHKACFIRATGPWGYSFCSKEGANCLAPSLGTVIYGASDGYKTIKDVAAGTNIDCKNTTFGGDPLPGIDKNCFFAPKAPDLYSYCTDQGENCSLETATDMAYGANNTFVYKTGLSGDIKCDTATFGSDPVPNIKKACFMKVPGEIDASNYTPPATAPGTHQVYTGVTTDITDTAATLHGSANPVGKDTSGYFRYSAVQPGSITPVFCNEVFGNKMKSTQEYALGAKYGPKIFPGYLTNLESDTTYYYCAIASEKRLIDYGGVNFFTTLPDPSSVNAVTSIQTKTPLVMSGSSVYLNGFYNAVVPTETYFEYKKKPSYANLLNANLTPMSAVAHWDLNPTSPTNLSQFLNPNQTMSQQSLNLGSLNLSGNMANVNTNMVNTHVTATASNLSAPATAGWTKVGSMTHETGGSGNIDFLATGLELNTDYEFRAMIRNKNDGTINPGERMSFKTLASNELTDGALFDGINNDNYVHNSTPVPHTLGETVKAPVDATVRSREGIETVFARQIMQNFPLAKLYGYTDGGNLQSFAWSLADILGKAFGYVNSAGNEVRVSQPNVAAYELQVKDNKVTVYEYYNSKIVDVRTISSGFKSKGFYEYYYKK